ncbi:MAG: DoxX family protein [Sphingobacteriales bacterium]
MLQKFIRTDKSYATAILRVMLGLLLLPHGAQKMLGWFGGYGFSGTMNFFTATAGLPWIIGFLVIVIEFFGAVFLITGFATRLVSIAIIADMTGIIFKAHVQNGFFMNWFGNQAGEGFEYHLLVITMAVVLLISGAGKLSVDYALYQKQK